MADTRRLSMGLSEFAHLGDLVRKVRQFHEGKHKAIISKKLFDEVQATLAKRGRPQKGATCGLSITAEKKCKHQKNGNTHEYVYYHCTRKHKTIHCTEPAVTEPDLVAQLADILHSYAMPQAWATTLGKMLDEDEKKANQTSVLFVAGAQHDLRACRASFSDF